MKPPLWLRLLAALGIIVVGVPAATLMSLTIPSLTDGFEPAGAALLLTAIVGLGTCVLLYRVARGDLLAQRTVVSLLTGVVISLGGVVTAYTLLMRSFENRYVGHMKSELRVLAGAQEAYFKDHGSFATDLATLGQEVRSTSLIVTIGHADSASWSAHATYEPATPRVCHISGTRATPVSDPVCK